MPSAGNTGTTGSANENNSQSTTSTLTLQAIGTIKLDPDTLDELLSWTPHSIHVSALPDITMTTETSLIKPSSVKLRKLSKAPFLDVQFLLLVQEEV